MTPSYVPLIRVLRRIANVIRMEDACKANALLAPAPHYGCCTLYGPGNTGGLSAGSGNPVTAVRFE